MELLNAYLKLFTIKKEEDIRMEVNYHIKHFIPKMMLKVSLKIHHPINVNLIRAVAQNLIKTNILFCLEQLNMIVFVAIML